VRAAVFYPKPICRMERIPVGEFLTAFCPRDSVAVLDTTKCMDVKLYQRFSRQWAVVQAEYATIFHSVKKFSALHEVTTA
jgi:hypothetical protein